MNLRQRIAFTHPTVLGQPNNTDEIVQIEAYTVLTRLVCRMSTKTMGNWQAYAEVTLGGEGISMILLDADVKSTIRMILEDMLSDVGQGEIVFTELASAISAARDYTHQEFEDICRTLTG